MQVFSFNSKSGLLPIAAKDLGRAVQKKPGFLWIDAENPTADDLRLIGKKANLLPETLEVIMERNHPPIIETQEKLAIFVMNIPSISGSQQVYSHKPFIFIIAQGLIITIRYHNYSWIPALKNSLEKNPKEIGDDPYNLFYRAVRRIIKETQSIVNGWETAMPDFAPDVIAEIENISLVRFIKIKAAAEELYGYLVDASEIFESISDKSGGKNKGGGTAALKNCTYLWESLIEQTTHLIRKMESSLDAFRAITMGRQRRSIHLLSKTAIIALPILIALSIAGLILPRLGAVEITTTVFYILLALVAGTTIGVALSAIFKEQ
jgi:Mg2+ and Co2+ transporter CorA